MLTFHNQTFCRLLFHTSAFALLLLLAACNSSTSTHPTSNSITVTTTAASITTLKTYSGATFRLSYPQGWQVQGSGDQVIIWGLLMGMNVYHFIQSGFDLWGPSTFGGPLDSLQIVLDGAFLVLLLDVMNLYSLFLTFPQRTNGQSTSRIAWRYL